MCKKTENKIKKEATNVVNKENKDTSKKKSKSKTKTKTEKMIVFLTTLLILVPLSVCGYIFYQMYSMYDTSSKNIDFGESTFESIVVSRDITNILLIGIDARNKEERGRADAIMIATIDEKHKTVKITSIARDTYVHISTKNREEKINHAYSYGGANLLKETIESNFKIPISSYVRINFTSFTEMIDALGGIELNVKKGEINELNKYIPECYESSLKSDNIQYIKEEGAQVLNGYQALSYARIRKNDSAIERDRRQRDVIQALMNELSQINILEIPKIINVMTKYVSTDMKPGEILKYTQKILKMSNFNMSQLEFPISEYSVGKIIDGKGWVLTFDYEKCLPLLHSFIYEEDYELYINNNQNNTENYYNNSDIDSDKNDEVTNDVGNSPSDNVNKGEDVDIKEDNNLFE